MKAEEEAFFIPADKTITFPSVNDKIIEPEGSHWVKGPLYAEATME